MAKYQILSWHGIPIQVKSRDRAVGRVSKQLAPRFMEAVDKAAMAAKQFGADEYMESMTWSAPVERAGSAQEVVEAVAGELEAQFPEIDWWEIARQIRERAKEL